MFLLSTKNLILSLSIGITLELMGLKIISQANRSRKQGDINSLLPDKIDFKSKWIRKDKEKHFLISKEQLTKKILQT